MHFSPKQSAGIFSSSLQSTTFIFRRLFDSCRKSNDNPSPYHFAPYLKCRSKIFLSNECIFLPDVCQLGSRQHRHFCSRLNMKLFFFSPNSSKFAVECDWNSKNSQNVHILGYFGKIDGFFFEKNLEFFSKSLHVAIFF